MSVQDISVKEKLLNSGKEEFLLHGFRNASLRRICSKAGVTTGALYFFFNNKEDLFGSIIEKPLTLYHVLIQSSIRKATADLSTSVENEEKIMRFLITYREEYILILEKSTGTKYEGFFDEYRAMVEKVNTDFFEKYAPGRADPDLIKIIVGMRLQVYLEIIHGNYSVEESIRLAKYMACYADAGFSELIRKLNEGN